MTLLGIASAGWVLAKDCLCLNTALQTFASTQKETSPPLQQGCLRQTMKGFLKFVQLLFFWFFFKMQQVTKENQLLCFIETFLNSSQFASTHESYCHPAALAFPQDLVPVAGAALQELPQWRMGWRAWAVMPCVMATLQPQGSPSRRFVARLQHVPSSKHQDHSQQQVVPCRQ